MYTPGIQKETDDCHHPLLVKDSTSKSNFDFDNLH